MASKLIVRRKQQPKKATVLVSKQTLESAVQEAESLVSQLVEADVQDERLEQLDDAISFLTSVLNKAPLDMRQEGASSLEDYLDDTVMPEMATKISENVNLIAKLKGDGTPSETMGNSPDRNVEMKNEQTFTPAPRAASGSDNWVTDRENDGEPKEVKEASGSDNWVSDRVDGKPEEPVLAEVPRLASKITAELFYGKKAAPVAVPAKAPAPAASNPDADIQQLSSDVLAKMLKALSTAEDLMNDKAANRFIGAIAKIIADRPVEQEAPEPAAAPAAAAPMPMAASFAGLNLASAEEEEEEADSHVAADRRKNPFADDMKRKKKEEDEDGKKKEASTQGGSFVNDGETGSIVEDGGRTPEVAKAHAEIDDNTGIKIPATELVTKFAEDMSTGTALKKVEKAGDDLKALYLEIKKVTKTLDSRPVREAVESVYRAYDMFGEAAKVLNKQKMQEEAEAQALEVKEKNKGKKSSKELYCTKCKKDVTPKSVKGNDECSECGRILFSTKPHSSKSSSLLFGLNVAGEDEEE